MGVGSGVTTKRTAGIGRRFRPWGVGLRGHERFMQAIVDALSQSVIVVNRRGIVQLLNRAAALRLGRAPEQLIGVRPTDLDPHLALPGLTESSLRRIQEVVRSGRPICIEEEWGGSACDTSYHPVCDLRGRVSHVVIFDCDTTGRERPAHRARRDPKHSIPQDVADSTDHPVVQPRRPLTPAEVQVLRLIVEGMSNKAIAAILHRSERTVETHRNHVMHKLHTQNVVGLVKQAMHLGLVDANAAR